MSRFRGKYTAPELAVRSILNRMMLGCRIYLELGSPENWNRLARANLA